MITDITAAHTDRSATELTWSLGRPEEQPLTGLTIDTAFGHVELRVLGTSHQVVVDAPELRVVETVATREQAASEPADSTASAGTPGVPAGLPRERAVELDGGARYRFHSVVARPEDFEGAVADLTDDLGNHPRAVTGVFDRERGGLTGLRVARATADELTWETWHCYPATREIVSTATTLLR